MTISTVLIIRAILGIVVATVTIAINDISILCRPRLAGCPCRGAKHITGQAALQKDPSGQAMPPRILTEQDRFSVASMLLLTKFQVRRTYRSAGCLTTLMREPWQSKLGTAIESRLLECESRNSLSPSSGRSQPPDAAERVAVPCRPRLQRLRCSFDPASRVGDQP